MTFVEALGELGLEAGASPEAIRAAYLKLLRVRRPDRDPQGFQRLREAYERAQAPANDAVEAFIFPAPQAREASTEARSPIRRELDRVGPDPLRAMQRIHLLDEAFSRAPGDEEVVMLLIEELLSSDLTSGIPEVLSMHRPAKSARPWEWALKMMPELEVDQLTRTLEEVAPEVLIEVGHLLVTHRGAEGAGRRLVLSGLRTLVDREVPEIEVWRELQRVVELLPLRHWLLVCRACLAPQTEANHRAFAELGYATLALVGETLRMSAPRANALLSSTLPSGAARDVPGDPAEEPMLRYLRLQLDVVDARRGALKELVTRRPRDEELLGALLRELLADRELTELTARLAAYASATSFEPTASPVWAWAVAESATLLKLSEGPPPVSPLHIRMMLAWALAASGHDPDAAARILWGVVSSTPEHELVVSREFLLVAVLETCARSMSRERGSLMEWLWLLVRASDLEFARNHPRQIIGRTMETVIEGIRRAIVDTNFVRPVAVAAVSPVELLHLRDQTLVHHPLLARRPTRSVRAFVASNSFLRAFVWCAGLLLATFVFLALVAALGGWAVVAAIVAGAYYLTKRSPDS